jgi:deoxyribodipyrimidine photo-lyase
MSDCRILTLKESPADATRMSVMYVMSRDQRSEDNHALLSAQTKARELNVPLVVVFIMYSSTGVRSREQYQFMVDGLIEVEASLALLNIPFHVSVGEPLDKLKECDAALQPTCVYFDFSPLTGPRQLAKSFAATTSASCYVVDTHNIVPLWAGAHKKEYAAHTMRRKIHLHLAEYLKDPGVLMPQSVDILQKAQALVKLNKNFMSVLEASHLVLPSLESSGVIHQQVSGSVAARRALEEFMPRLNTYANGRNDIAHDAQSGLSPYLHFGHISSLRVALEVLKVVQKEPLLMREIKLAQAGAAPSTEEGMNALLEEMIVRKELADNFCFYAVSYKTLDGVEPWAQKSLNAHREDPREFVYDIAQWEAATTHDKAWNAAQRQLKRTGKMHGYMRMYWAKKILEWSASPEEALKIALYLNDHYSLDGGDPNGYVGILWSIAGVHDRPWFERPVFGTIRYMNVGGLSRKFDLDAYTQMWAE